MAGQNALFEWVREATGPLGAVTMRRMMGGATLYLDGIAFAIIADGQLWLKSDSEADAIWDEAGCARFTYKFKDGRTGTMNYRLAPDAVQDDAEALQHWARLAHQAGVRGAARKRPGRR